MSRFSLIASRLAHTVGATPTMPAEIYPLCILSGTRPFAYATDVHHAKRLLLGWIDMLESQNEDTSLDRATWAGDWA